MSELIVDLLNYSRSGRATINCEPLDLTGIANELVNDYRVRNKDNNFHFEAEENLGVNADKALMRIALTNLLYNAIKYSGNAEHPEIILGSKLLYGQKVFFIKDNGVGFDMAKAEKLFNPFVRLHTSVDFNGTGIGLSTVKRIFNRHGGDVWAESEPGKGATFFFNVERKGCEGKKISQ
jgi:signal transduction histidine kinase